MQGLNNFIATIKTLESERQINDVLQLLPHFEGLDLQNWQTLLEKEDGEPCTTPLYQSGQVKVVLIYWKGKQTSSIHGHPGGGGLIKVLSGSLQETRYDPGNAHRIIDRHQIKPGCVGFIHDIFAWHQVSNPSDAPAVSLHVYSLIPASEAA